MNYEDVLRRLTLFSAIIYLPNDYNYLPIEKTSTKPGYPGTPAGYEAEKLKFSRATNNVWSPSYGTTCGYLCHFLPWLLGNRDAYTINRTDATWNASHPSKVDQLVYQDAMNINRLVMDRGYKMVSGSAVKFPPPETPKLAYIKWANSLAARPEMGDIVHIATPGTNNDHVFVFLKEDVVAGKFMWLTADMGQESPWGQQWADGKSYLDPNRSKNPFSFGCFNYRQVSVSGTKLQIGTKTVQGWVDISKLPKWQWFPPSLPVIDLSLLELLPKPWDTLPNEYGNRPQMKQAQDLAWQLAEAESWNLLSNWPYPSQDNFGGQLYSWLFWSIYDVVSGANATSGASPALLSLSSSEAVKEMSSVLGAQSPMASMSTTALQGNFETLQSAAMNAQKEVRSADAAAATS